MWRPDSEFWSANRTEHRFAEGYELVAFDLPAANGYPAIIGWELFGGLEYMTLVASGQAASLSEAKDACEAALVSAEGLGSDLTSFDTLAFSVLGRSPCTDTGRSRSC
jgi:hypothetical protein